MNKMELDGLVWLYEKSHRELAQAGFARLRRHASLWLARNRESPRIAFSLRCLLVLVVSLLGRVPTLRLIGSAWPERQRGKSTS